MKGQGVSPSRCALGVVLDVVTAGLALGVALLLRALLASQPAMLRGQPGSAPWLSPLGLALAALLPLLWDGCRLLHWGRLAPLTGVEVGSGAVGGLWTRVCRAVPAGASCSTLA